MVEEGVQNPEKGQTEKVHIPSCHFGSNGGTILTADGVQGFVWDGQSSNHVAISGRWATACVVSAPKGDPNPQNPNMEHIGGKITTEEGV